MQSLFLQHMIFHLVIIGVIRIEVYMYQNIHWDINRNDKQGTFITFITHHNAINQWISENWGILFLFFLGCLFEQQQQKNVYVSYLQATEYRSCLLWAYAWIAQLFSSVSYLQMFFCDRFWKNTYNNNGLPLTR